MSRKQALLLTLLILEAQAESILLDWDNFLPEIYWFNHASTA